MVPSALISAAALLELVSTRRNAIRSFPPSVRIVPIDSRVQIVLVRSLLSIPDGERSAPHHDRCRRRDFCLPLFAPHRRFSVATLFRIKSTQASAFHSLYSFHSFERASRFGAVDLLDLLWKMQKGIGRFPIYTAAAMNGASKAGHVAVLQWWKERGLAISFTPKAIVWASQFGHIGVLDWWKAEHWPEFGHHVRRAFLRAAAKGNVQVLQWWQNNLSSDELQSMMKFIPKAAVFASQFRRIHVLEWLKTKGLLEFGPHVKSALGRAGKNGYTDVLQWWKENLSDEELQSIHLNVNNVSCHGHASSLQVLKESGVTFVYKRYAMDSASGNGHPDVLQWWKDSKLELRYTADAIDSASDLGLIEVLQWWKDSGLELKYTTKALLNPCKNRNLEMLNWWINSGLELPYDAVTLRAALDAGLVTVVHRWWELSRGEDNVRPDYKDALPLWQDWIQTVLPADDASCRSYSNSDGTASDNESDDNASDDSGSATTSEGSDWRTYCYDLV